jgi:hypothetical protein
MEQAFYSQAKTSKDKQRQAKTSKEKQRDENKIQEVQVKVTDKKTRVKDKEDQWFEAK